MNQSFLKVASMLKEAQLSKMAYEYEELLRAAEQIGIAPQGNMWQEIAAQAIPLLEQQDGRAISELLRNDFARMDNNAVQEVNAANRWFGKPREYATKRVENIPVIGDDVTATKPAPKYYGGIRKALNDFVNQRLGYQKVMDQYKEMVSDLSAYDQQFDSDGNYIPLRDTVSELNKIKQRLDELNLLSEEASKLRDRRTEIYENFKAQYNKLPFQVIPINELRTQLPSDISSEIPYYFEPTINPYQIISPEEITETSQGIREWLDRSKLLMDNTPSLMPLKKYMVSSDFYVGDEGSIPGGAVPLEDYQSLEAYKKYNMNPENTTIKPGETKNEFVQRNFRNIAKAPSRFMHTHPPYSGDSRLKAYEIDRVEAGQPFHQRLLRFFRYPVIGSQEVIREDGNTYENTQELRRLKPGRLGNAEPSSYHRWLDFIKENPKEAFEPGGFMGIGGNFGGDLAAFANKYKRDGMPTIGAWEQIYVPETGHQVSFRFNQNKPQLHDIVFHKHKPQSPIASMTYNPPMKNNSIFVKKPVIPKSDNPGFKQFEQNISPFVQQPPKPAVKPGLFQRLLARFGKNKNE